MRNSFASPSFWIKIYLPVAYANLSTLCPQGGQGSPVSQPSFPSTHLGLKDSLLRGWGTRGHGSYRREAVTIPAQSWGNRIQGSKLRIQTLLPFHHLPFAHPTLDRKGMEQQASLQTSLSLKSSSACCSYRMSLHWVTNSLHIYKQIMTQTRGSSPKLGIRMAQVVIRKDRCLDSSSILLNQNIRDNQGHCCLENSHMRMQLDQLLLIFIFSRPRT